MPWSDIHVLTVTAWPGGRGQGHSKAYSEWYLIVLSWTATLTNSSGRCQALTQDAIFNNHETSHNQLPVQEWTFGESYHNDPRYELSLLSVGNPLMARGGGRRGEEEEGVVQGADRRTG